MPGRSLPRAIVVLGVVSLLTDVSSELVHSLLPIYMTAVLGASIVTVGIVEGIAEATASVAKVFSGVLSDSLGNRKWLAVFGYGLSAASKPLFPLAASVAGVFMGRFLDRVGKGIRGSPRDALVADITPPELRGAAFGLRQALDSVGACVGPLLAVLLMMWWKGDVHAVLWIAVAPALAAVALLATGVREPERPAVAEKSLGVARTAQLPRACWTVVTMAFVFTLARFERGVSDLARPGRRNDGGQCAGGNGGDERGLRGGGVPGGRGGGSNREAQAARGRAGHSHRGGRSARAGRRAVASAGGRSAVGAAHGVHARAAVEDGGR